MRSTKDSEEPESLLEHLQRKWLNFFQFFDANGDSVWTASDLRTGADKIVIAAGNMLSESGATHVRKQSQHWLQTQEEELCQVGPGEITADLYCQTLQQILEKKRNGKHLLKDLDISSEIFFDIIDINRDGKISRSELRVYYTAMGIHNPQVVDPLFRSLDLVGDGQVSREEFRIAYREYFFGDQRQRFQTVPYLFDKTGLLLKQRELFYQDD